MVVILILFGTGLEPGNYAPSETNIAAISADQGDDSVQANTDLDMLDDDHLSLYFEFDQLVDQLCILCVLANQSIYSEFTNQGWQPPQQS